MPASWRGIEHASGDRQAARGLRRAICSRNACGLRRQKIQNADAGIFLGVNSAAALDGGPGPIKHDGAILGSLRLNSGSG